MAERTIILKGERQHIRKEGIAGAAIVPGMLVSLSSDGKYDPHGTAAGEAARLIAVENELKSWETNGVPIAGSPIDQAYADNDRLYYASCAPGVEVYALLAAGATAVVAGTLLESAGDGTLRNRTAFAQAGTTPFAVTPAGFAIARAMESVDNSGGGSRARIIVEML